MAGWTDDFLAELAQPKVSPKYIVEFVTDYHDTIGEDATFSSHGRRYPKLIGSEVSVGGGRVSVGTWAYTKGGWTVLVVDDEANGQVYELLSTVQRGNYARLLVGFPGWAEADYECVAIGALRGVSGVAPEFLFSFDSLLTHWHTRHDNNTAKLALFDSLDLVDDLYSANVTAKYDPATDTVITVDDTTNFDRGSGGVGVIRCSDSTYGDDFYITYTGETATTFTGCSTTDKHLTAPVCLGATGAKVYAAAYLEGHPCDIVQQILLSTGSGDHGAHDVLPVEWGFAAFEDWVDSEGIDDWKDIVGNKSGTDHDWCLFIEEGQDDAIGWVQRVLSEAGLWLVQRQGQVSLRAAQNTNEDSIWRYEDLLRADFELTDDDILSVQQYEFWSPDVVAEAASIRCWYYDSHDVGTELSDVLLTDGVYTLPAYYFAEMDLSMMVYQSSDHPALDVLYRVHEWVLRVPEYVKLVCAGLRAAQLCPGDIITVTSSLLRGRLDRTKDGWIEVDVMVVGVNTDWMGAQVTLDLAVAQHVTGL